MSEVNTSEAVTRILAHFKTHKSTSSIDVRESIALVDFYLKIAYTLLISFSRRPNSSAIKLQTTPGFGSMLAAIRQGAKLSADTGTPWIRELIVDLSESAATSIDKFKTQKYRSFKTLRDRLSHGQPLPTDKEALNELQKKLSATIDELKEAFDSAFSNIRIHSGDDKVQLHKTKERAIFEVSPLWTWSKNHEGIRIYSHVASDGIHYIDTNGELWSEKSDESISSFVKTFVGDSSSTQFGLGRFVKEIIADLAAFTEDYSKPSYFFGDDDESGHLFVPWTRSTSDENQSRIDTFRIGPDNRREWRNEKGQWTPYSDFLKSISNWKILARRIAIGLDSYAHDREEEESSRLGTNRATQARGPSRLKRQKDSLPGGTTQEENFELMPKVDESCQRVKPSTSVFFLIGQAGLGKTELMVSLASDRAKSIESSPDSNKPLYLFVSSTGRTLSSLEDAVNSSLNITKLLSSQGAKALCRNGLLVLLVDGFDELLGSSGYENALGSLEPWFRELGGRGVLVASARSSYYLTQYRRSLAQAVDLNVDHTLVELQPWSRSESTAYLRETGVADSVIKNIKDRDWQVLSVPFFAKAFAAWLAKFKESSSTQPSIYDIVIEQYLDRESGKLTDPHIGPLLNSTELRELFSEAAELMQGSRNREIELSELTACAELVIGSSNIDNSRPGLSRRLSSLCGLGVSTEGNGPNRFGFAHEVLFDCFLSLALQRRMTDNFNAQSFLQLLSISKINSSVFEWLIEKSSRSASIITEKIHFGPEATQLTPALAANLGALWEVLLTKSNGIPATNVASGLQIDTIHVSNEGWNHLDLRGSTITHLIIPAGTKGIIDISDADIALLECDSPESAKHSIRGANSAQIHSIHIGQNYEDSEKRITEILAELEIIPKIEKTKEGQTRETAKYMLGRLSRRPDVPVIVDRDDLTIDDQRLSWASHIDTIEWNTILNKLIDAKVARLEPITASGRPKARLTFNKPIDSVLNQSNESAEISSFWSSL